MNKKLFIVLAVFIFFLCSCDLPLHALTMRWCDPSLVNNIDGKDTGAEIVIRIMDADGKQIAMNTIYNGQALTIAPGHKQPYTIELTSSRTGSNVQYVFKADDYAQLFIVPCESSQDTGKLAYYIYGTQGPTGENSADQNYLDAGAWYCNSSWYEHKTPYKKYLSSTTNADCYYCPNSTHGVATCPTYSADPTKLLYNHCKAVS